MISQIAGTLVTKELDHVEIMTAAGLGYLVHIPLSVYEALPKVNEAVHLHTSLVVKEDGWQLFGFTAPFERHLFELLLTANGVGPALGIGLLSSLTGPRLLRAIVDKDINTLQGVPRVGRKKAERLILDLADKLRALSPGDGTVSTPPAGVAAEAHVAAVRALVSLGYGTSDAEQAVRSALDSHGAVPTPELIRAALAAVRAHS